MMISSPERSLPAVRIGEKRLPLIAVVDGDHVPARQQPGGMRHKDVGIRINFRDVSGVQLNVSSCAVLSYRRVQIGFDPSELISIVDANVHRMQHAVAVLNSMDGKSVDQFV